MAIVFLLLTYSFASADLVDDAVTRMFNNNLTIFDNKTDFNASRWLRRDEATKFYVNFARLAGEKNHVRTANQCVFSDIDDSRSDLKDFVIESCRLWLFQGSKGKFYPQNQITNAQAITVLVRLLAGNQDETWQSHWANNYYAKAEELWILQNVTMNNKDAIATRGNVWVMIHTSNTLYNTCAKEWGISSLSRGPEYYKPCCSGLEEFGYKPAERVGGGVLCVDPNKWTPLCQQEGTNGEWRYYADGSFLLNDNCIETWQ